MICWNCNGEDGRAEGDSLPSHSALDCISSLSHRLVVAEQERDSALASTSEMSIRAREGDMRARARLCEKAVRAVLAWEAAVQRRGWSCPIEHTIAVAAIDEGEKCVVCKGAGKFDQEHDSCIACSGSGRRAVWPGREEKP